MASENLQTEWLSPDVVERETRDREIQFLCDDTKLKINGCGALMVGTAFSLFFRTGPK